MCGICGFTGFEDTRILNNMIRVLAHRGPDGSGSYSDGIVSLGHTRLSIIDLSIQGRQPMSNEEGTIWITYNGETYNYQELRNQLPGTHTFRSHTDTEALIHAYEDYGIDFINKTRSMFAFALYDSEKKMLFLARDHLGKKPLYYFFDGKLFIFASEIKAILEAGIPRRINTQALASFLSYEYTLGQQTLFEGVKKVPAGHYLCLDLESNVLNISKYWDIQENITSFSIDYYIRTLRRLLEESARLRTVSDVPVGAFLSGGLDSSVVVGLTRPHIDYPFHTFTMGFGEYHSELPYAAIVAEHFDTCHHEIILDSDDALKKIDTVSWHYDEPISDAAVIANFFLAKEASKEVKVVIAGEGGDEIFAGYNVYKNKLLMSKLKFCPPIIRQKLNQIREFVISQHPHFDKNAVNSILTRWLKENYYESVISNHRVMNNPELELLSGGQLYFEEQSIPSQNCHNRLNSLLEFDCKNILSEKYLMKGDKATMAHGLEERLPLIDREVVDFMFTVPPQYKIYQGTMKFLLKKAVEPILPRAIILRRKEGFNVPNISWIQSDQRDLIESEIYSSPVISKYISGNALNGLSYKGYQLHDRHSLNVMWNLYALSSWYRVYFT